MKATDTLPDYSAAKCGVVMHAAEVRRAHVPRSGLTEVTGTAARLELRELYAYWEHKRGARFAPSRADIRPEEIRCLLPHLLLLDLVGEPTRFRYRLVGTGVTALYGREVTGIFVDEVDHSDLQWLLEADCITVTTEQRPVLTLWDRTGKDGRSISHERLLLPLSKDGRTVDMLMGGAISWIGPAACPSSIAGGKAVPRVADLGQNTRNLC
jgi:hypothetical protein